MNRFLLTLALFLFSLPTAFSENHRVGGGIHYWRTIDDIDNDDEFDEDGVAWIVSYQMLLNAGLRLEADIEFLPDGFGGAEDTVLGPQGYILLGQGLYAGLGIGWYYTDSEFSDDPFYALRLGLDLPVGPNLYADIHANYRFTEFDSLSDLADDVDTDTITLGAALRAAF